MARGKKHSPEQVVNLLGLVPLTSCHLALLISVSLLVTGTKQAGQTTQRTHLRIENTHCPELKRYCLAVLIESLVVGERVAILDKSGRLKAELNGWIPKPPLG